MFYLHASNRTENLLQHLSEVIRVDKQPSLFAREIFLIQSQGMERMIAQVLADSFRSFCNFGFFLPIDFLGFIATALDLGITPDAYQRQILTWRLDELLRDIPAECYKRLRHYLSGENKNLKRFQLARQLANVFDQYQVMRADMLVSWEMAQSAVDHPEERWQMDLWQRLVAQPGGEIHRGTQFQRVITLLNGSRNLASVLPKRISVIGLHSMPPIFLDFLSSLSRHLDVHLFVLSPCRHYWGDLANKRKQLKREVVAADCKENVNVLQDDFHPLLVVFGRQGRDFQKMMLESVDFQMEFESFADPLEAGQPGSATLLQQLQSDVLNGQKQVRDWHQKWGLDDSIQVVSCHSKFRELGVLKDHILRLLHNDTTLALREIIVMAPDIQDYASLIPALFSDIQHSIADRSLRKRNTVLKAFLEFLHLYRGRFGWSEVFDVLRQSIIAHHFHLTIGELDTLQNWVVASGIRWGLSGKQRADTGLPGFFQTSWRAGLERLLMGYAIDSDQLIDEVLPFADIEGRGAQPLGGLCSYMEIVERGYGDFKQSYSLEKWTVILLDYVDQLFGEDDDRDLMDLRAMLADLGGSVAGFHSHPVDFEVLYEWFSQSAKESRSSSGFLRGQLTFCSMLPMRSIPFKVVCLLGLNDGVFPKNDNHATFDIMGAEYRRGDRSPRADDRYQFLEAVLAARSHFYCSYIGQSIKTNEKIPPSVVLTEFLEAVVTGYGVEDMVVHHPLHPFSVRYFDKNREPSLWSYNRHYCQVAEKLQQQFQSAAPWWTGKLQHDSKTIPFVSLVNYFKNPQRWFIKKCLNLQLNNDELLPEERENFQSVGLEKYHVEQDLIRWELNGRPDDILQRLQLEGRWSLGAPGQAVFNTTMEEIVSFVKMIRHQDMGLCLGDQQLDMTVGNYHISGMMENLYENGIMLFRYGGLRGRDLLAGWLSQLLLEQVFPLAKTCIVTKDGVYYFEKTENGPSLVTMVDHFVEGCTRPSIFFVEPAFAYVKQMRNKAGRLSPLACAIKSLRKSFELGYEPEWQLLFGTAEHAISLLDESFEQQCQEILGSIWSSVDGE